MRTLEPKVSARESVRQMEARRALRARLMREMADSLEKKQDEQQEQVQELVPEANHRKRKRKKSIPTLDTVTWTEQVACCKKLQCSLRYSPAHNLKIRAVIHGT